MYRLAADVFNDVAMILDCLSPALPKVPRVILLSFSSMLRALCGVCAGSSKASLSAHFATQGNLGELNAVSSSSTSSHSHNSPPIDIFTFTLNAVRAGDVPHQQQTRTDTTIERFQSGDDHLTFRNAGRLLGSVSYLINHSNLVMSSNFTHHSSLDELHGCTRC